MTSKIEVGVPGQRVRITGDPGRIGVTEKAFRKIGSIVRIHVRFSENNVVWLNKDLLELIESEEPDLLDDLEAGRFGSVKDLRMALTAEKLSGRLTNVFYSMESSNTDFYPHQFKPVLRFLESPTGRLLIADEVGLGKTIEAIYVWKELEARDEARRLLIVCPAILREKWKDDLLHRFGIHAEIIDTPKLVERLTSFQTKGVPQAFRYIVSLEGARAPRDFAEGSEHASKRAELASILDANPSSGDSPLLDLTIIDEAHYLRNPSTQAALLGRLLRDASQSLLLLTATPIQIHSQNLFHILNLISPEDFDSLEGFDALLNASIPLTRALKYVWQSNPDLKAARTELLNALATPYYKDNRNLQRLSSAMAENRPVTRADIVSMGRRLETASIISNFMSRSRKREVLDKPIERRAVSLGIRFSDLESDVYETVTQLVRERASGLKGARFFGEVGRQVEMASCMPAAISKWRNGGFLEETLIEQMGLLDWTVDETKSIDALEDWPLAIADIDLQKLELEDSKYREFQQFIKDRLKANPKEKFVVFAFFTATIHYLHRRLKDDGIRSNFMMGGMGEKKWSVIREFSEPDGPNVLLSTEVGSEGIDLQFCRILVNYDLPWNPMKVEQRIGRLDRLGQKAPAITIVNLFLRDTVEERILERLYQRIRIFEESVGDLEDILGDLTERLVEELFRPDLSEIERERNAEAISSALENNRQSRKQLEEEAVNLTAFSGYVLDAVRESRDAGRWLSPSELMNFTRDFLHKKFPGTDIQPSERFSDALEISLSRSAKVELHRFKQENRFGVPTKLDATSTPVTCLFDPKATTRISQSVEVIDPSHPLVRWTMHEVANNSILQRVVACKIPKGCLPVEPGQYAFFIQKWSFNGFRSMRRLVYRVTKLGMTEPLPPHVAEEIILAAQSESSADWDNVGNLIEPYEDLLSAISSCVESLYHDFENEKEEFDTENQTRCDIQAMSARRFAHRRLAILEERLGGFERSPDPGKRRIIPATKGLIEKERITLAAKMSRIEDLRRTQANDEEVLVGAIEIVEDRSER